MIFLLSTFLTKQKPSTPDVLKSFVLQGSLDGRVEAIIRAPYARKALPRGSRLMLSPPSLDFEKILLCKYNQTTRLPIHLRIHPQVPRPRAVNLNPDTIHGQCTLQAPHTIRAGHLPHCCPTVNPKLLNPQSLMKKELTATLHRKPAAQSRQRPVATSQAPLDAAPGCCGGL